MIKSKILIAKKIFLTIQSFLISSVYLSMEICENKRKHHVIFWRKHFKIILKKFAFSTSSTKFMCRKSDSWYSNPLRSRITNKKVDGKPVYFKWILQSISESRICHQMWIFFHQKIKPTRATRTYLFQMQLKLCTFLQQIGTLLTTPSLTTMGSETPSSQDSEICDVNSSPVVCLRKDGLSIGCCHRSVKQKYLHWYCTTGESGKKIKTYTAEVFRAQILQRLRDLAEHNESSLNQPNSNLQKRTK